MSKTLSWHYPKDYSQRIIRKTKDRPFVASFNLKFWISGMNCANYLTVYDSENKNKLITYKLTEE